jgi:hypothetical protein
MEQAIALPTKPANDFSPRQSVGGFNPNADIKFIDGRVSANGQPVPQDAEFIALRCEQIGRHFPAEGGIEMFTIDDAHPISLIDELNNAIPREDWRTGLSGAPEEPWKLCDIVYLVREIDGATFRMTNSTRGMAIACENLVNQVRTIRRIRGADLLPVVKIGSAPMKTRQGIKMRPSFDIVRWLGSPTTQPMLESKPAPTATEIVDDAIPF